MITHDAPGPWESVNVVEQVLTETFEQGLLVLDDGRRVVIPDDVRCHREGLAGGIARQRWTAMKMNTSAGTRWRSRMRLAGDRLAVSGRLNMWHHPDELAISAALGLDAAVALESVTDEADWVARGVPYSHPPLPNGFAIGVRNRLSGGVTLDDHVSYSAGKLVIDHQLPESAISLLKGRPLRDLLAIARLEALDLRIHAIEQRMDPLTDTLKLLVDIVDEGGWIEI